MYTLLIHYESKSVGLKIIIGCLISYKHDICKKKKIVKKREGGSFSKVTHSL